jgi:hypothetical protein
MIFRKNEVAQRNVNILGYFLSKQIYYIFTLIGVFKTWFIVGIFKYQTWFNIIFLEFQIEL